MKLIGLKYKPYSIKLRTPFINSKSSLETRNGFIISISGEMGRETYGEAAPLDGFSMESLADVKKELDGISDLAPGFEEAKDPATLRAFVESINFTPSVRFGIEQAMTAMQLKRDRSLFSEILSKSKNTIDVNAVIDISDGAVDKIRNKINKGFTVFKIKAGRVRFEEDLDLIKRIRAEFGNGIKIRLDVNGKWSVTDAELFLDKLNPYYIEFVEEPCSGIDNIIEISKLSPIRIAVDESIKNFDDAVRLVDNSNISFIIIKPMVLGGFFRTAELIAKGALKNKNIIISSSFETYIGKSLLVFLASLTHHNYAHGLDTGDYFDSDFSDDPYKIESGFINFSPADYPPKIDYGKL